MSEFIVTLPSNSNMVSHPNNEPANYTVQLATPISLQGEWEAALVSVQYTHNWLNTESTFFIRFVLDDWGKVSPWNMDSPEIRFNPSPKTVAGIATFARHDYARRPVASTENPQSRFTYINPQHFSSPQALGDAVVRAFELAFPNAVTKFYYKYNYSMRRGSFFSTNGSVGILITSPKLANLLGHAFTLVPCGVCTDQERDAPSDTILPRVNAQRLTEKLPELTYADIHPHHFYHMAALGVSSPKLTTVTSLWVYSDITENQLVGNYKVPLLGVIPVTAASDGERTHYCVNPVHFLPVNKSYISTITIKLVNERGERIPFSKGACVPFSRNVGDDATVVCCLRFRRRKTPTPI